MELNQDLFADSVHEGKYSQRPKTQGGLRKSTRSRRHKTVRISNGY